MADKASILGFVGEIPEILGGEPEGYLAEALRIYSIDRPYRRVLDVTGGGANLLATPTGWVDGASRITKVVYPYEDEDSTELERDEYEIDTVPVAGAPVEKIRLLAHEPAATETVRLWYETPHTLSNSACTVYAQDEQAFVRLVKSLIASDLASIYLRLKDQGLDAQLVDYGGKANEARATAKMHLEAYRRGIGIAAKDEPIGAAAVGVDVDVRPQWPGASPHVHRSRRFR